MKQMNELEIGDLVLSVHPTTSITTFSPIYVFPHAEPAGLYAFKRIRTLANYTLTVSADHYIYISDSRSPNTWIRRLAVTASTVKVGDGVWVVSSPGEPMRLTRVVSVDDVWEQGRYAPFTLHGNIITEGVAASVYTNLLGSESMMHNFCVWGRWLWHRCPGFFIFMHARGWGSHVALKIGVAARYALQILSFI